MHASLCYIYLDEATSSSPPDLTTHHLCHEGLQLESANTHTMRINSGEKKNVAVHCDHSESTSNCMISYGDQYYLIDWEKYKSMQIECECDECTSEPETTSEVELNLCNNSTTVVALGALAGLLLVLLAVVTAGWIWTCWLMRERRMNPDQIR